MNTSAESKQIDVEDALHALADQLDASVITQPSETKARSTAGFEIDHDDVRRGLGQLVLTVVRLLHELLQRQAIRRLEGGLLEDEKADELGRTLALQAEEIEKLASYFGLEMKDLTMDLGPLGKLL